MAGPYSRILLKISGEGFAKPGETGLDVTKVQLVADQLKGLIAAGTQIAVVVGGGNIVRGSQLEQLGVGRGTADYMGMLGTVINALALQDALEENGVPARVMSSIEMSKVCEPFIRLRALRHMEKGRVVILGGGLGLPYFTTDTCAAQRGVELGCDALLKATKVKGVYDKDPAVHDDAELLTDLTYDQVLDDRLRVMDQTAFTLCRENGIPIVVFRIEEENAVLRAATGEAIGSIIHN